MSETTISVRVATKLRAMAQSGVDRLSAELVAISAPPALRAVVLEEMAALAMKEAAKFSTQRTARRRP